jgi:nucleotide-binding universal stress UspA family protein
MKSIDRILFPTDLSPAADAALAHAAFLSEALGARLVLFHVAGIPVSEYAAWGAGEEEAVFRRIDAAARQKLQRSAERLGAPCEIIVRHDTPSARVLVDLSILDQIHRTRPGLVVMPMQSRSGFSRFFVGSVTEEVVRHSGVPVLAIRDPGARPPGPYRVLLLATDLSEASRRVFPTAGILARRFGARVVAVHVAPPDAMVRPTREHVRAFLRPDFEDTSIRIEEGPPWRAIVRAAEEEQADLVAIARHGVDTLGEEILGSTTDRVLRHAPCPVLVA